jgi:Mg-chelatase subunit ChlD
MMFAVFLNSGAWAQPAVYESEPNDRPADLNRVSGAVKIMGSMSGDDQDGFMWSVSDVDAQKRWTLELQGIAGRLTTVDVMRIEWAENGVDVAGKTSLFSFGSRDGAKPAVAENLIFEPGEYVLGVAHAGGGGTYRPPADSIGFDDSGGAGADVPDKEPGGYRLTVREGDKLYLHLSRGNESQESAHELRPGSEFSAYMETPASWFRIEIDEQAAEQRWDLRGQVPAGQEARSYMRDSGGAVLSRHDIDAKGKFSYPDLALAPGSYYLEIQSEQAGTIRAVAFEQAGQRIRGAEAEPNDKWQIANRADLSQALTGRMGQKGESDYFLFSLDEATADQVLKLQLDTGADQQMQLCLHDDRGTRIQCRSGKGSIVLPDLVLEAGEWGLAAERGPEGAEYTVTLTNQGAIQAGVETEPNDRIEYAAAVPSNNRIKGRFSGQEDDFYRILVTEDPQLWRFQVIGDEIHELGYHDGAGIQNQKYRVPAGQRRVRLDNVFLLPGVHHVRVSGRDGGSYTLIARPIGPPDPNGEFEPNDDTSRMQPLRFGQTRTGLLEDKADYDNYRFHLAHWDRIRLTIEPPADGEIMANLYWDTKVFKQFNLPQPGQKVVLEGLFPPGDYRLSLHARTTSEAEYGLSLERLDRFGCPADCEPNDNVDFANPFPASHVVEGRVNEWRDGDWYALPVFDQATVITIASEPKRNIAVLERAYSAKNLAAWDREAKLWRGTIPAGLQTYLQIKAGGEPPYRFEVSFPDGPAATATPAELPLTLAIELETPEVGAYRQYGQQVAGTLQMTNSGPTPVTVELESATSDYRWRAELGKARETIPAGGTLTVALTLHVPADAWADWPVRISARAANGDGAQVETFTDINAGRETPPVNAVHGWTFPEALRGGFNVAWDALGGRWTGEKDTAIGSGFPYLFDGMAVQNQGLQLRGGIKKKTTDVIVELAGNEALEVAGFALNAMAGTAADQFLRNVDFSLSLDGSEFTPVAEDVLLPIRAEQAFVLAQPVKAKFARLQLKYGFDGRGEPALGFGELKVIARPGIDISGGKGFNLADPTLGGHVAWSGPPIAVADWDSGLLEDEDKWQRVRIKPGQAQDFVIGFHHARAAQITRIDWLDAEKAEDEKKFRQVVLSASMDSPIGPWVTIGEWDLTGSGAPATFELDRPVWARYVKFSATGENESGHAESPALIRIWERPTNDEYRSILSEWGFASQAAIYEALHPLPVDKPFEAAGHDSRVRAAPLEFDQLAGGQVVLGKHEHWYELSMPADQNTLRISIGGDPTVRTVVHLEDADGTQIPIRKIELESTPQLHIYEAIVDPGGGYYLKIEEPPRNVVFLWDTSASVGAYLPVIYNSLIAYAEDVVPGRDAANLIPFGGNLLLRDWYGEPYILQTVMNDYPRKENSSEAEKTLNSAAMALAQRAGTKAIVMVTDAATNRYPAVWESFDQVQPRIFALGVGSQGALGRNPAREQDLMQDWARVNGGHYTHLLSEGEMEIAFDRAATMLRRPAGYTLEAAGSFREAPGPGSLAVVANNGQETVAGGAVLLILDASGSMLKRMDGKRRIAIAKEVLNEAVNEHIPAGTAVALRVFGHKEPNACRTDLEIALQPLDPASASRTIEGVNAMNLAKTPIADSLAQVETDLKQAQGRKVVVLVTDGEETCDGDPEKVIQSLRDKGIDVTLNIVGFAIDDTNLESQFKSWSDLGGGRYFSAQGQEGLSQALKEALQIPYAVYDLSGGLVAEGVVGGGPLELEAGFYRVTVASSPAEVFEQVEIPGEEQVILEAGTSGQ